MLTIALAIIAAILAALSTLGISAANEIVAELKLATWIPIGLGWWVVFLFLIITPCRIWISQTKKLRDLTSPRVALSYSTEDVDYGRRDTKSTWFRLRVHNKSGVPIPRCYGKIVRFNCLYSKLPQNRMPGRPHYLPWSLREGGSGGGKFETDLPGGKDSSILLDIATIQSSNATVVRIPAKRSPSDDLPDLESYDCAEGLYEFEIAVGSNCGSFPESVIRLRMAYKGGADCTLQSISD